MLKTKHNKQHKPHAAPHKTKAKKAKAPHTTATRGLSTQPTEDGLSPAQKRIKMLKQIDHSADQSAAIPLNQEYPGVDYSSLGKADAPTPAAAPADATTTTDSVNPAKGMAFISKMFGDDDVSKKLNKAAGHRTRYFEEPEVATLSNGIRIITQPAPIPIAHVSLSLDAGSRYENPAALEQGMTHFMERSLLRSTSKTHVDVLRNRLNQDGADLSTAASRENLMMTAITPCHHYTVVDVMSEISKHALFKADEISADVEAYREENAEREDDRQEFINDMMHITAFGEHGLGQSLYATDDVLDAMTSEKLQEWHKQHFTAERMVIGAVGVPNHKEFVQLCEEKFGDVRRQKDLTTPPRPSFDNNPVKNSWVGSDMRVNDETHDGLTHVILGMNAPSLSQDSVVVANVLQSLLGGGSSFSSGGPGKGMYTRFYQNVLCKSDSVDSVNAFINSYTDCGVLSVYGMVPPHGTRGLLDLVMYDFAAMSQKITEQETSRAKNMLKSSLLNHMQMAHTRSEELARNIQVYDQYKLPILFDQIDDVQPADIQAMLHEMMNQPLAVAVYGDQGKLPSKIQFM